MNTAQEAPEPVKDYCTSCGMTLPRHTSHCSTHREAPDPVPHLGHWLLAEKLLGRPVPTSEPYPCLRREVGYRHCACADCNPKPDPDLARALHLHPDWPLCAAGCGWPVDPVAGATHPACDPALRTSGETGLPADEFAKLLANVTGQQHPPCDGPSWFGTPCDDSRPQPAKSGNPAAGSPNLCDQHVKERNIHVAAACADADEDVLTAVKRICRTHSDSSARSQQKIIGLSEIGDPCDRAVAYRLLETPAVNTDRDNHLADVGTAWHTWVAAAFEAENQRLGRARYVIEERVFLTDGYSGTADLFDTDTGRVLDHKLLGVTSLRKIRDGEIPEKYRVQLHAYGYGHARAGRQVQEVALICYPRSDNLGGDFGGLGLHIHVEPYDEQVALQGLDRLGRLSALGYQLDPEQHPDRWSLIPATPGEACRYCPFFRPSGGPADATGCPGQPADVPTSMPGIV